MSTEHPNVIVILADDLGCGDLGCFGNERVQTPYLDALANQGVCLTQHYSASPMCAPARAALLTGRYNHRTGAVDVPSNRGLDRISLREITLANAFAQAGYATGMVGKWHNGLHDRRYHPNARGFREFTGFLNGGMDYWRWVLDRNGAPQSSDGRYLTDVLTDEAVAFVQRHKAEPFFLYAAYNAPHSPLQAPEPLIQRYRDAGELTEAVCRLYAMIEAMDAGIGRLLETVEKEGLARNTIVLFTSDNGPYLGGAGQDNCRRFNGNLNGSKGDALEGGIRVPAILRWPQHLPARLCTNGLVHFCDWYPTLLSLARVRRPFGPELDGHDVTPVLRGGPDPKPRAWFWQWNRYEPVPHCNAAMHEDGWKLYWPPVQEARVKDPRDAEPYERGLTEPHRLMDIDPALPERRLPPTPPPRLFNLVNDPGERMDMAPVEPERVARMRQQWDAWFARAFEQWRAARHDVCTPDDRQS